MICVCKGNYLNLLRFIFGEEGLTGVRTGNGKELCAEDAEEKMQRFAEEGNGKGEIRGSLHCAALRSG